MRSSVIAKYLRWPEHPGKLRVVRALARTVIPEAGVVAPVHGGIRLCLHPRDWIEYLLLRGIPYEPLTLQFIRANLRPGDGAVLAGVNFGLHVAVAAMAVSAEGLVVGVEPQPAALVRARRNLALNELTPQVHLVAAALGRAAKLIPMAWSNPENAGAASLLDEGHGVVVPMIRLGEVLPLLGNRRFRLLLLDVQGYEEEVLAGAELHAGPELMIVELDPEFLARAGSVASRVAERLTAAGYDLFDVYGNHDLTSLVELPERNLVAVKRGVTVRWGRA
jgi:FkbM family methyltransferase